MKVIDLTHLLHEDMPVYPGMSRPSIRAAYTVKEHGYRETMLSMLSHTGTHMDAPAHMLATGASLDQLPASAFMGPAFVFDMKGKAELGLQDLIKHKDEWEGAEFLLFCTGWNCHWGKDEYFRDFPVLTPEAAKWVGEQKLKGIGLDAISADRHDSDDFPIHHLLFGKGLLIIENLTNLEKIIGRKVMFSCLPLKYGEADGSPVRAVAWY